MSFVYVHERDEEPCCATARMTGESHYHCANCGEVSSMFGHYNRELKAFTCARPAVPAVFEEGHA